MQQVPIEHKEVAPTTTKGARRWVQWLWNPGSKLSQRVVNAGLWMFAANGVQRFLMIIRTIVLARLLAPADFGLLGVALLVVSVLDNFTITGFKTALIQKKGEIRPYLDTAWTIETIRGIVMSGVLILAAPYLAGFFNAEEATLIVQVIAIKLFFHGIENIGIVFFQKELEFHKRFILQLSRTIPEAGIGIGMAIATQSVWALAYGVVAGSIARMIASYFLHPYRPRPRLDWAKAKELYRFGIWVLLNNVMQVIRRGDSAVIGRLLGPVALATYELARGMTERLNREIRAVIESVAFPAYAQVQDQLTRLRQAYLMSVEVVAAVILPLATITYLLSEPVTRVVLGDKWIEVSFVLPALAAAAGLWTISSIGISLFRGVGKPSLGFYLTLIRIAVMFAFLYPLLNRFGLPGAGIAVLIGTAVTVPITVWYSMKILEISLFRFLGALVPAISLSGAVALAVIASKALLGHIALAQLILTASIISAVYLAASVVLWQIFHSGPIQAFIKVRPRI